MDSQQSGSGRMESGGEFRVVLTTAPDEAVGARLARGIVDAGLAACVNRVSALVSTYRWQGRVEEESEVLLVVKTRVNQLERLAGWLREHHPYDVPECVALEPAAVEAAYAAWLRSSLGADTSDQGGSNTTGPDR
jgi:periplasmic divalent cation tolerance protein